MMKVFLDTNVALDFLMHRDGFFEEARAVMALGYNGYCELFLSSLSFSNIAYIARKKFEGGLLYDCLAEIRELVSVTGVDQDVVDSAIALHAKDFEDAMQYFSARSIIADCIVTRNVKDFPFSDITVMTPHEFLQKMNVSL